MENLKIYGQDGKAVLERDLAEDKGPLMVLAGDVPRLVDVVEQGVEVIGALVRDEDGWVLASAKADLPVVSGSKRSPSSPLASGVSCSLGPWAFRLDTAVVAGGPVLLWRVGSGALAVERLVQGRNTVVVADDGSIAVNPPVSGGDTLCEIFPTIDGVDVVTSGVNALRFSVERNVLFAVGRFQAMAMDAEDAAAAVKSGNPFSWPSRKIRSGLLFGVLVVAFVCLCAMFVTKQRRGVEAALAAKTGAVQTDRHRDVTGFEFSDEDVMVYDNAFIRSLPMILKAESSPVTRDLITRGVQLMGHIGGADVGENEKNVAAQVRFLKDVDAIQLAVQKGDWEKLNMTLAETDKSSFVRFDANEFLADAVEIADFVQVKLPEFFLSVLEIGTPGLAEAGKRVEACFDTLGDNLFLSGVVVRRERDAANARWTALSAYIPARDKFLNGDIAAISSLLDAWATFVEAFDEDDAAFAPLVVRERKVLSDALKKRAATADDVALISLCDLGEAVGMEDSAIGDWRRRAEAARKELAVRYRTLYSDYRMKAAVAPAAPETLAVLDQMIKLGLVENPFHQWALREKERVSAPAKEESK